MDEEKHLSKKERRRLKQEEQRQEKERQAKAQKRKKILFISVATLLVVASGTVGYFIASQSMQFAVPEMEPTHLAPGQTFNQYNTNPPTSGPHVEDHPEQQISDRPVPKEIQVHVLEHGGIMIQYNCQNCDDLISKLGEIAKRYKDVYLAPYPDMDAKIALTAWGKLAKLEEYDEKTIVKFIKTSIGINHGR
ncbi:MAG: DUF3105 domain-containing protein [Candidatus Tectomicrobia bacterium]|nr:DUF3105 domain-containing protein [Candidatus Tectomicrobia bacterium]